MVLNAGDGRLDGTGAYAKASGGQAPHQGAVYVVAGSGGSTGGGSLDHPAMFAAFDTLGSLVLDVNGSRLDARFLDAAGTVRDHFTILKQAAQPVVRPAPPSALSSVALTESAVDLAWLDNADNESGYHVERCAGSGCAAFVRVATGPAGATRYRDASLGAGATYRYRVSAFNAAGESASSNIVTVTTLAAPPRRADYDADGVDDLIDNCPALGNPSPADRNWDDIGDACEDPRRNADFVDTGSSARRIDGSDYFLLAAAFGSRIGNPRFDPVVDLNRDHSIDGGDLAILASVWAETVPR